MGEVLGKAIPFMTIVALLTALGFTIPMMSPIEYGPFTFEMSAKSVDIVEIGSYNFTIIVKVTNNNATDVFIQNSYIGIYYDENKYSVISTFFLESVFIPADHTSTFEVDGYFILENDDVPKRVYVAITGQYIDGGRGYKLDYEKWLDLSKYWPG